MADEPMVLMMVKGDKAAPTLAGAAELLKLEVGDLDAGFGVVPVDPERGLYSVRARADRVTADRSADDCGPFSDPKIEPMGPVR